MKALDIVERGHNLLVKGQARTGKSFLVRAMYDRLKDQGRKVEIVCASGIAGSVYSDKIRTSTVHACYGLQTANLPSELVIERAVSDNLVEERIRRVDTIIWDKGNISSQRVFELVNGIHVVFAPSCVSSYLFGGKQVVLIGDFLQVRPMANFFDLGRFLFESLLVKAISHWLELTTILRQNADDRNFNACLKEIRYVRCVEETLEFISSLSRDLWEELMEGAVHIFLNGCQLRFSI